MRPLLPLSILSALFSWEASASCLSPISGSIVIRVERCGAVSPESFDTTHPTTKFIKDLDPTSKKEFYESYRGVFIKGVVIQSQAFEQGQLGEESQLFNETVGVFQAKGNAAVCAEIGKTKHALLEIKETCCNGGVESPCLLGTNFTAHKISATSNTPMKKAVTDPHKAHSPDKTMIEARQLFQNGKYREVVKKLEAQANDPDASNKLLGVYSESLFRLEDCAKALKPLKKIYDNFRRGKVWSDEEALYRRSHLNLAACYARTGDVTNSVYYLNEFLSDAKKFQREIEISLRQKEFGWIHTSREYLDYKKAAQARLKALRANAR